MNPTLLHALRFLRRRPGYAAAAIVTVALGVGANAAVFQVLHDVLLRPLDIEHPERVTIVWETDPNDDSFREGASLPDYDDFRREAKSFSSLAAYQRMNLTLSGTGEASERLNAIAAAPDLLPLLGHEPLAGRALGAEDDRPGAAGAVLLSEPLARRRYGSAAAAVGREVRLDGREYAVVGVLPTGIELPAADAWVALEPHVTQFRSVRGVHSIRVVGRLADGVELGAAQAEMDAIATKLATAFPDDNAGRGVFVEPVVEALVGESRRAVILLAASAALVLLVTCSNLAGLALAQIAGRGSELALRTSLGAGTRTLVGQLATEATIVALVGGALGALVAGPALGALLRLAPGSLPRAVDTTPNPTVFLASLAAALGVACAVALAAAYASSRVAPASLLGGRGVEAKGGLRLRRGLVVTQLAFAVALAVAAGLLMTSFGRLRAEDPGVDVDRLAVAEATLPSWRYPMPARTDYPRWPEVTAFYDRLLDELAAIPGARSVALALNHPLEAGWTSQVEFDGVEVAAVDSEETRVRPVTPGYFATVGLPMVAGRDLAATDRLGADQVVVVNRALVKRYLAAVDPIGRRVNLWGSEKRIVGVVEDERFLGLDRDSEPAIYPALHQVPMSDLALVVRSDRPSPELGRAMEAALRRVDPDVAAYGVRTLGEVVESSIAAPRLRTTLFAAFGALALVLAAVGLYGVVAADVERRRREHGVRMALGARAAGIVGTVVRRALGTGALGAALGLVGALAAGRTLAALLYRTSAFDPWVLSAALAAALAVAIAAAVLPALRAARLDPVEALRSE